jgi:hypothetical protein
MMNQVQIYTEERKNSMNYQSKKTPGFYNADYKTHLNSVNRSFEKGYAKSSGAEKEKVDFRFIVPWQMH